MTPPVRNLPSGRHGAAAPADFAEALFAFSAARGGPSARVTRIRSDEYVTRVRRPLNALLDCRRIADVHGVALPSVGAVVARLRRALPGHVKWSGRVAPFQPRLHVAIIGALGDRDRLQESDRAIEKA